MKEMEREQSGDLSVHMLSALSARVGGPQGRGSARAMLGRVKSPALSAVLLLASCGRGDRWDYPVYRTREAPIYYVAPGGAHVPLDRPIERTR